MPKSKSSRTPQSSSKRPMPPPAGAHSAFNKAMQDMHHPSGGCTPVSPRWLIGAGLVVVAGALACAWLTLCLLFWQGSWQLLYHPKAAITRTPGSLGMEFEAIHFAATETGKTQLAGWWIPASQTFATPHPVVLFLHGAEGNLADSVDELAALHSQGLDVFAVDYRGYGQSQSVLPQGRPNEKQMRQDAEWSLTWLTLTRSIPAGHIVVFGSRLGANLAAELAADHGELAGVVLEEPLLHPMEAVFRDSRSRLVPAHWLVSDRYDLTAAARKLEKPSLWLIAKSAGPQLPPDAYQAAAGRKSTVWLSEPAFADPHFVDALRRWLDDLQL